MRGFLGLDPGEHGAGSILSSTGKILSTFSFHKATEAEMGSWFKEVKDKYILTAALEKVRSSPQMGCVSAFTFGWNYGLLRGLLAAVQIPFEEPVPQTWQGALGCLSKGDKRVTKQKAHELWPQSVKLITHELADSLLIAEWLRQKATRK
jgi:hypothetical protein